MAEKKKIPCRVCGTLFEPCAFCQSHGDVFRWRNFACSRECATKYINDTIAYRESLKNKDNKSKAITTENENMENTVIMSENTSFIEEKIKPKRTRKKNDIKIEESEQID